MPAVWVERPLRTSWVALPAFTVTVPLLAVRVPTTACTMALPTRWPVKVLEAPLAGLRSCR